MNDPTLNIPDYMLRLGARARSAARLMASAATARKNAALERAADRIMAAREHLRTENARDMAAGRTLTRGPHRTELIARHRDKDQTAGDCSTGEQKALILTLALAQAQ